MKTTTTLHRTADQASARLNRLPENLVEALRAQANDLGYRLDEARALAAGHPDARHREHHARDARWLEQQFARVSDRKAEVLAQLATGAAA